MKNNNNNNNPILNKLDNNNNNDNPILNTNTLDSNNNGLNEANISNTNKLDDIGLSSELRDKLLSDLEELRSNSKFDDYIHNHSTEMSSFDEAFPDYNTSNDYKISNTNSTVDGD